MTTKVTSCKCSHRHQDTIHGEGQRVHNQNKKGEFKCTSCGNVKK